MNPAAALIFLPYYLLAQIIFHVASAMEGRRSFAAGIGLGVGTALFVAIWYHRNRPAVEAAIEDPARNAVQVAPSFITERMLGMHFKYHTELCLYDGWRPPLHDPLLVMASWLNHPFFHTGPQCTSSST